MLVRDAGAGDIPALAEIFFRAVRDGATAYSAEERAAWAPQQPSPADWARRLDGLDTVVADLHGALVGFMSWRPEDAYLDLAFVLPDQRGRGVADGLYCVLETRAQAAGHTLMQTHASRMARPFFARHGWVQTQVEHVQRGEEALERFVMSKPLGAVRAAV